MIEQIDEYLTEFLDGRYHLNYQQIDILALRYPVRNLSYIWTTHPLVSNSLQTRLNCLGIRLNRIIHNIDDNTGEEVSIEFYFAIA